MSLSFNFCIGHSTVCDIVREMCEAFWNVLHSSYVQAPSSEDQWIEPNQQFESICGIFQIPYVQTNFHSIIIIMSKHFIFAMKVQLMATILLSIHRLMLDHSILII